MTQKRRRWTEVELALVRLHYPDTPTPTLAQALARPTGSVHQKAAQLGLRKVPGLQAEMARAAMADPNHGGRRAHFQAGREAWNKGREAWWKDNPNCVRNRFKPGSKNGRSAMLEQPIGAYRINCDGYLDLKVSDEPGPAHRRWKAVHRLVWEAAHGPVPAGHAVVFKGGARITDPQRITPDVLELITRRELMARNTVHNHGPEIARLVQMRGQLVRAINRKTKEQNP